MKVNSLFKSMFFLLVAFLSIGVVQAQEKMITGSVVDKTTREFLPGVTIAVEGTARGTITDFDGNFTLKVNQGDVLNVSYIGYITQKITVGSKTTLSIELSTDTKGLDEVLVIGYGSVKKEDATGSVEAVSSKDFNAGAISSPQDLLVGKASGVQITNAGGAPGAGSTIRIRGGSSMTASNDPLIVIDGVPMDNGTVSGMQNPLNSINPADIKTFTVLKDASSTAIYGSRASNGVILITTKTGKKAQEFKVNYSGNVSVGTPSYQIEMMDGPTYREFVKNKEGVGSEAYEVVNRFPNQNTNWQDEIYRTSISTDHNVSLSGGLKSLPYRLSLGFTDQKGILKTSAMQRETVGLNMNPTFFDDQVKVAVSAKYMHVENDFANEGAIGSAITYDPTKPIFDESMSKYGGYTTIVNGKGFPVTIAPSNPVALLEQSSNSSKVDRGIINGKFDYTPKFFSDLTATLNLGLDVSHSKGTNKTDVLAAWSSPNDVKRAGEYAPYSQNRNNQTLDFYLTYNKTLEDHNVKVMGGYSYQEFNSDGTNYSYNAAQTNLLSSKIDKNLTRLVSFFGRAEYSYKQKYLLNVTMRADGTSRFSTENRWGYFPAFGFAWKVKQEGFLKDVEAISSMKFRAGWGLTGQQGAGGDNPYLGTYTMSDGNALYPWIKPDGTIEYIATSRPNGYDKDIKWEETETYNVGIDFGFFDEKLSGSVEWYYRKTNDLLSKVPVAAGANFTNLLLTNVGNLTNQGVEFNINYNVITTEDLNWTVGANMTYNVNEITKLTANDDPTFLGNPTGGISGGTGSTIQMNSVGYPTNSFFVYEQVYDKDGRPLEGVYVDQNQDGLINDYDKIHKGQAAPNWMIGLNTRLQYKNWDFAMSGRFQFGASIYNNNASTKGVKQDTYNSGGKFLSNRLPMAETGFETTQYWSSHYVESADFFKLDNVSLGYTFKDFSKVISSLRVNATAQNLFIISNYTGVDPEVASGIDNNFYPRSRTYMFGVNIAF